MMNSKLPKYIVDKDGHEYKIWNTVDHEYVPNDPNEPPTRDAADKRAKELNEKGED